MKNQNNNHSSKKREHLNDIKEINGRMSYQGDYYRYCEKQKYTYHQSILIQWVLAVIMTVGVVINGCLPVPGMQNTAYVIIPYVLMFTCQCRVMWALIRLTWWKNPLRTYIYRATFEKFGWWLTAEVITCIMTFIGNSVFIIRNGVFEGKTFCIILFSIIQILIGITAIIWKKTTENLKWEPVST